MRCKQGDLAVILKSVSGLNDGKIVTVEQYLGYFQALETFNHNGIECRVPITDHYWWIYCPSGLATYMGETSRAYGPDTWLKPLPPDLLGDDEETGDEVYNIIPAEAT